MMSTTTTSPIALTTSAAIIIASFAGVSWAASVLPNHDACAAEATPVLKDATVLLGTTAAGSNLGTQATPAQFNNLQGCAIASIGGANDTVFLGETSGKRLTHIRSESDPAAVATTLAVDARATAQMALVGFGDTLIYAGAFDHNIYTFTLSTGASDVLSGIGAAGGADGPFGAATFNDPQGLVYDGAQHRVFTADAGGHILRVVDVADGHTSTVGGKYATPANIDGSASTTARLFYPRSLAQHPTTRDRYVGHVASGSCALRHQSNADGTITTVAGSHTTCTASDGVGLAATFGATFAVTMDTSGHFAYVADEAANVLRRVQLYTYVVTTVVGTGTSGLSTAASPVAAQLASPRAVCMDPAGGRLLVGSAHAITSVRSLLGGDCNPRVVDVGASSMTSTFVTSSGHGVAYAPSTNSFHIAGHNNHKIRRTLDHGKTWEDWLGDGTNAWAPGTGTSASVGNPLLLSLSVDRREFFVPSGTNRVVRVDIETAYVSLMAGDGTAAHLDSSNPLTAQFSRPICVSQDPVTLGVLVVDQNNHRIREILPEGAGVTTLAGDGTGATLDNGNPLSAQFNLPTAIGIHPVTRHRYVTTYSGGNIMRIRADTGDVKRVAGGTASATSADGFGTAAVFNGPHTARFDPNDNFRSVIVPEATSTLIRRFDLITTYVSTVLGSTPGWVSSNDPLTAQVNTPHAVDFNADGSVMVIVGYNGAAFVTRDEALCPAPAADAKGATHLLAGSATSL